MTLLRLLPCLLLCQSLWLLAACAPAGDDSSQPQPTATVNAPTTQVASAPAPAAAPTHVQVDQAQLAQAVRQVIQDDPDMVLQLIKDNPRTLITALEPEAEALYRLLELGAEARRRANQRANWEAEVAEPLQPVIDPNRPRQGPADAPFTIVEYSDFECPYCSIASQTVHDLLARHPGLLNLYFKHMPLKSHDHALPAAKYFEAAGLQDQDKAWELYDRFFNGQSEMAEGGEEWMLAQATELGLDVERLKTDAQSEDIQARIDADTEEAQSFGARGTPYFLVGGVSLAGAAPIEDFEELLVYLQQARAKQAEQPQEPEQTLPPAEGEEQTCLDCLSKDNG